ncbi:MAG: hypothetical protein IT539_16730 [Bradyrhizobiaceae bacterium]|nr:hypothetical protein [Bradyrhizobiaceae bacterium]
MAEGDRPDDAPPPPPRKRRRKPPVLDLKAKEIGGATERPQAEERKEEQARAHSPAEAAAGFDWRALATNPLVAASVGLIAGAAAVYALMPRAQIVDPQAGALRNEIATLSARIEELAARPPAAPDMSALGTRIDRLTAAIGEAEKRLAAVEQRPEPKAPDLSGVTERTAAIESAVKDLRGTLADLRKLAEQAPPAVTPAAIDSLANRIGGLEQRIASLAAARTAATSASISAEIVALNALTDAIRSGKPFVKELEAARARLGDRAAPLAALDAQAEKGLPTVATLAERFDALVPQLLRGPDPAGGFFSRLYTNAVRLVEVRPVGEPEGTSAGAIVARMETKLARGDLAGALAESDALPEPAKSTAASWLAAARERQDAEAIVKKLSESVLTGNAEREKP